MTKKSNLAQSFQKLITLTKHILFFWNFENRKQPIVFYNLSKFHSKIPLATYWNNKTNKQEKGADQTVMDRLQTSGEL
jgi:hypothetical protein